MNRPQSDHQKKVLEFMERGGQFVQSFDDPKISEDHSESNIEISRVGHSLLELSERLKLSPGKSSLSARLLVEEVGEILLALGSRDLPSFADGLADLEYILLGCANRTGIDLGPVFEEVHRANLSKFPNCKDCSPLARRIRYVNPEDRPVFCKTCEDRGVIIFKDEHGKITKPPQWTPPDIEGVLEKQDRDNEPFEGPARDGWRKRGTSFQTPMGGSHGYYPGMTLRKDGHIIAYIEYTLSTRINCYFFLHPGERIMEHFLMTSMELPIEFEKARDFCEKFIKVHEMKTKMKQENS